MKLRRLLYGLCLLSITLPSGILAQSTVDVTALTADTKTFIFSDNKNTVKNYIYEELKAKTQCTGTDRIYLEVKIAPSGYVLDAKTLTGKNDCFKKSAIDIVKNIKWDAASFKGPKSVYFEIKPEVDGEGRDNTYAQLPLFNNGELDVNGVPIKYPGSTGVSATEAGGGAPTGVPATPPETVADAGDQGDEGGDEGTEGGDEGTSDPVAGSDEPTETTTNDAPAQPVASSQPTRSEATSDTPANNELSAAEKMAKMRKDQQDAEIARLKKELADMKAAEEEKKEADRRAAEEAERKRIADAQAKREEEQRERDRIAQEEADERRRQRQAERDRIARQNNDRDNGYGNDNGYNNSSSGGYSDPYASNNNRPTDPPPQTAEDRARDAQRRLEQEQRDLEAKIRETESARARAIADEQRFKQDLLRKKEQFIDKQEEITQLMEKAEIDRLREEKQKADEIARQQQRILQDQMDNIRRLQAEADRKMQELQRLEADLAKRTQEEATRAQEIAQLQTVRSQQNDNEKARLRLEFGAATPSNLGGTSGGNEIDFAGLDPNDPNAILIAQIAQMRKDIQLIMLQINNSGAVRSTGNPPSNSNQRSTRPTRNANAPKSAATDKSWQNTQIIPPGKEDDEVWRALRDKQEKKSQADKEHDNLAGPKVDQPSYQGGEQAMKEFIATKLKEAGVCGLAQAAFEVTVDGEGAVRGARVLNANDANINMQLTSILPSLQFESLGNRIPSRAIYQFKAEIVCEGQERSIDLQSVDDLIKD